MLNNLSLQQKAILLVATPLLFEVVILCSLLAVLIGAEAEADRDRHAKSITQQSEHLLQILGASTTYLLAYSATKGTMYEHQYEQSMMAIPVQIQKLKEALAGDKKQAARMQDVELLTQKLIAASEDAKDTVETTGDIMLFVKSTGFQDEIRATIGQIVPLLQRVMDDENELSSQLPLNEKKSRDVLKLLVVIGLLSSVGVAGFVAVVVNHNTLLRLRVLMDNTGKLLKKESLHPVLDGKDEIAHLDRTFHSMANSMMEMEQLKQDFVNMISHDLRTPLTSLHGTLELLATGMLVELNEPTTQVLTGAKKESTRLIRLIDELLSLEKLAAGQMELDCEWTDLQGILDQSVSAVETLAKRQELNISVARTDVDVFCDRERIIQVLVNLLSNAIKFSPAKSTVSIVVDVSGSWITVKVKDEGSGIPAGYLQSIFERFKQVPQGADTIKRGTGLGLFICKTIVEQHQGNIGVASEPGKGSEFWIRLPAERAV